MSREKVNLIEEDEIIESDINTAQILNTFFSNIVSNLKIAEYVNCDPIWDNINDPVIKSSVKYRNHPSILKIGELCNRKQCSLFSFSHVDKEEILKEILSLDSTKVSHSHIPTKITKDIFSDFLLSGFNNLIATSIFPSSLKQEILAIVFKKGDKNSKENYRPVSILPNISKISERFLFKQISNFMEPFFSKQQCGFRKGYST